MKGFNSDSGREMRKKQVNKIKARVNRGKVAQLYHRNPNAKYLPKHLQIKKVDKHKKDHALKQKSKKRLEKIRRNEIQLCKQNQEAIETRIKPIFEVDKVEYISRSIIPENGNNEQKKQSKEEEEDVKCGCKEACSDKFHHCYNNSQGRECTDKTCDHPQDCRNRRVEKEWSLASSIEIRECKEEIKGYGCFAWKGIGKGSFLVEYSGEYEFGGDPYSNHSEYTFYVSQTGCLIHAEHKGNWSRYLNTSKKPNCLCVPIESAGTIKLAIYALEDINKDTELTISYGNGFLIENQI